ncbi:hypothetical protein DPMN_083789 [Dreissena polymorpha]|uniref:Uncharacterized protein n=1 Tax=Dreissena polymorpha TaxID=45954 RepID=A0A9D3YCN4_DREPO|nr:hypothetical protein DPMN_083789 [Dreissena polymorpha]
MGGTISELQDLTNRLDEKAGAYRMEVCTGKSKIMVNITTNTSTEYKIMATASIARPSGL